MSNASDIADREIIVERVVGASRERVWEAWVDPRQVDLWWGPRGFTTTTHEMEVRPGGVRRLTMVGPDGAEFVNRSLYKEVVRPERLVFVHSGGSEDRTGVSFEATVTFEELAHGQTRVTMRSLFPSAIMREMVVREFNAIEGGRQTLSRLGEHVEAVEAGLGEIVSSRVFDKPRATVFAAFSKPEILARWWGPNGFTSTIEEFDLRPGGAWRMVMHGPDGTDYPNHSVFVGVVPDERVVYDHLGTVHRFRMTMTLSDEGDGTRLTWGMRFEDVEEAEKIGRFIAGANEQNFDRLEAELQR
ncbi:MAG: SRPBCC family protein [Gemmataceae bacterium]